MFFNIPGLLQTFVMTYKPQLFLLSAWAHISTTSSEAQRTSAAELFHTDVSVGDGQPLGEVVQEKTETGVKFLRLMSHEISSLMAFLVGKVIG